MRAGVDLVRLAVRRRPGPRRVRGPPLGRRREPLRLRAARRARPRSAGARRHLPTRRALAAPPRRRPPPPPRPAPPRHPRAARPPRPRRGERVPRRRVRAGPALPRRRGPPQPHRRQPLLPRGARRRRRRPQHRGPRQTAPLPVDRGRGGAAPGRRPRPRRASRGVGDVGARSPGGLRPPRRGDRRGRGRADRAPAHRGRRRASSSRPTPTCSASTTTSPARRSRAGCSDASGAGSTRRRSTPCAPRAATTTSRSTHHAQGAGRYDEMVAEARLGAQASLRLGSTYQALQLAETGLCEADDDLELRALATEAAAMVGLLDDAAEHGDQWLAHARAKGDVTHEARALSLRMRIAFDLGDLPGMARFTDELIATVDQVPVRRGPGPGDDLRGAVPPAPRPRRPHLRVGRQGARDRHAQRLRRRAPRGDGGEGLGARGRAGLGRRRPSAPRGGRRRGGPHRRRRPRRPGPRTARVAGPGVEPPRRRPPAGRADAQARRGRRLRPAGQLRARRGHRVARSPPTATSTPRSRCSSSAAATIRAPPRPATADGCRCCAPAWPWRPATSARPPSSPRPPSR